MQDQAFNVHFEGRALTFRITVDRTFQRACVNGPSEPLTDRDQRRRARIQAVKHARVFGLLNAPSPPASFPAARRQQRRLWTKLQAAE